MSLNGASVSRGADGLHVETSTTEALATYLSNRLSLPVIDKTNLNGEFDIAIKLPLPDSGLAPKNGLDTIDGMIFVAVEQLGLRLVRQKNPAETIVVESASRIPTPN